MDLKTQLIDRDLATQLAKAGLRAGMTELVLPKIKRDGITCNETARTTQGTRRAVEAFRSENPGLFPPAYSDTTKTIEQLERERDQQIFGRSAAGYD